MASPQTKNGYLSVANEIIDAFCYTRISGVEWQLLWVILRQTYGWNKKQDNISLSQFVLKTKLTKPHIVRSLKALINKNLISVAKNDNGKSDLYSFIKDFSKWKPLPKKTTLPKKAIIVAKNGNKSLPKMSTTKDTIKTTIKNNKVLKNLKALSTLTTCEEQKILKDSCSEKQNSEKQKILEIILKSGEIFDIYQEDLNTWKDTFPYIEVLEVLKVIKLWNFDNPQKRKTARGIRKHISGWLSRENIKNKPYEKKQESNMFDKPPRQAY